MNNIPRISLEDTLSLIQLARETALTQGRTEQAKNLTPIVDGFRDIVSDVRNQKSAGQTSTGILGQDSFQKLLEVAQTTPASATSTNTINSINDRNRMIQAMASANMTDLDIARQFGITREEVRLTLNVNNHRSAYTEGIE